MISSVIFAISRSLSKTDRTSWLNIPALETSCNSGIRVVLLHLVDRLKVGTGEVNQARKPIQPCSTDDTMKIDITGVSKCSVRVNRTPDGWWQQEYE